MIYFISFDKKSIVELEGIASILYLHVQYATTCKQCFWYKIANL